MSKNKKVEAFLADKSLTRKYPRHWTYEKDSAWVSFTARHQSWYGETSTWESPEKVDAYRVEHLIKYLQNALAKVKSDSPAILVETTDDGDRSYRIKGTRLETDEEWCERATKAVRRVKEKI